MPPQTEWKTTKSRFAQLLNSLCEMQDSLIYAARKHTLKFAEETIVELERDLTKIRDGAQIPIKKYWVWKDQLKDTSKCSTSPPDTGMRVDIYKASEVTPLLRDVKELCELLLKDNPSACFHEAARSIMTRIHLEERNNPYET